MHDDMKPLSPFSDSNVLLDILPIATLHSLCVASGLLGLLGMALFRAKPNSGIKANQRRVHK
jgi:hypothetical protein